MNRWALLFTVALSCLAAPATHAAECAKACPEIYQPVCASDGKTYSNECTFKLEKCKTNDTALSIVSTGECAADSAGSASNSSGTPECIKEFACLDIADPVCGSNGVTYPNDCVLKKAQCTDPTIQKTVDGACTTNGPSTTPATSSASPAPTTAPPIASSSSSGSNSSAGDVTCSKSCTKEIEYVCGSDGVSYANECLLEQQKACAVPTLTKASDGKCGGADATSTTSQPPAKSSGRVAAPWATATAIAGCVFAAMVMA